MGPQPDNLLQTGNRLFLAAELLEGDPHASEGIRKIRTQPQRLLQRHMGTEMTPFLLLLPRCKQAGNHFLAAQAH